MESSSPILPPQNQKDVVSFGSSISFLPLSAAYAEFRSLGLSYPSFLALLNALKVPIITLSDNLSFVRLQSLRLALLAISRIGQSNFNLEEGSTLPTISNSDHELLVRELLFSKASANHPLARADVKESHDALTRFLLDAITRAVTNETSSHIRAVVRVSSEQVPSSAHL